MFLLGQQRQKTCGRVSRRSFMEIGFSSVLGLTLPQWLHVRAQPSYSTGSARNVILLWLWGGPSQLNTFDPKPNAQAEYRGPFSSIPTRTVGVRFCELFPQIAGISDQLVVLRSMHTASNDHGVAGTAGLTGSAMGAVNLGGQSNNGSVRPSLGSIVARAKGFRGELPPYMVIGGKLHQGKKAIVGEGGGTLGALYDPFRLEVDGEVGTRIPALQLPNNLTPERLQDRQSLLASLDLARRRFDVPTRTIDDYRAQAMALITSPDATRMFDLSREPSDLADRYGRTRFGQSCLLARRLVEHGVPFVQVNWADHVEAEEDAGDGGWDNHYRNFPIMQDRQAPWFDQTFTALLTDLRQRGLLDTTMVIAVGEFGRTPRINDKAGRDHWEHCYCAVVAGGGIKGGRVIGESDARAERPHDRPITPADLSASVIHAIGVTTEQTANLGITVTGRVIEELF